MQPQRNDLAASGSRRVLLDLKTVGWTAPVCLCTVALFRVDKRNGSAHGLLGYDWVEVLAIEPWALGFRRAGYGDWCDRIIACHYICLTEHGLIRISSDDFWAAIEEYGEYDELTPQREPQGIVITTGDASVVQTGGSISGGLSTSRDTILSSLSFDELARQLATLRSTMAETANDAADYVVLGAVAEAEDAAERKDERGVIRALARAGKSALDTAREIGIEVAATALSHSMGM